MTKILITGGAGFIGSHLVKRLVDRYPNYLIFNLDSLTYAGNLENLKEVNLKSNYRFIKGDITDRKFIDDLFDKYKFDNVIHLAAESHVDRSISNPIVFVKTNVLGTVNLLNSFAKIWKNKFKNKRFYHVSTDEVYGSLNQNDLFTEETPYNPRSPYSASKASSDHFVRAYGETYEVPFIISNCSNNFGEFHFPEKLIPLCISNIINKKNIPVYGKGNHTRDWLYVEDHVRAIDLIFHKGSVKETYNVGGFNEYKNLDLIKLICKKTDIKLNREQGTSEKLITFIKDRPGHDKRYAIDATKINKKLGWKPKFTFESALDRTIDWYIKNKNWLDNVVSGKYREYYENQYN